MFGLVSRIADSTAANTQTFQPNAPYNDGNEDSGVMNTLDRLRELKEKQKREGLTEDENAELQRAVRQWGLEGEFGMLEKQIRMLIKLAERSPVLKGRLTEEIVKALEPGTEYVLVEREQMKVLLEGLELHACSVKNRLSGVK